MTNIMELAKQIAARKMQMEGSATESKSIDELLQAADLAQFLTTAPADATKVMGKTNMTLPRMTPEGLQTIVGDPGQPTIMPSNMSPDGLSSYDMDFILRQMSKKPTR